MLRRLVDPVFNFRCAIVLRGNDRWRRPGAFN